MTCDASPARGHQRQRGRRRCARTGGDGGARSSTTHAGSLPRPDDLADMIWARRRAGDRRGGAGRADRLGGQRGRRKAAGRRDRRRHRRRTQQDRLQHLRQRALLGVRRPFRVSGRRRGRLPQPGDAPVRNAIDGAHRVLQLRRAGRADGQAGGAPRCRPAQAGDRRPALDGVHGRDQPRPDRVQLPGPALRLARGLSRRARRRPVV